MKNRWNEAEAAKFAKSPLAMRVYTSRLIGADPQLVLHGGGNTSLKMKAKNFFQDEEDILYVKGSGWDLATIEEAGFAPVKMTSLLRLAQQEVLSDSDMVNQQRAALLDPNAPNPSVEAILHAILPFAFVDHTHTDSMIAITNTPNGQARLQEVFGQRVLYVPYVMPGFLLARKVFELTQDVDWSKLQGIVLLNHGLFTFGPDAKTSYERMINLVDECETYLQKKSAASVATKKAKADFPALALAQVRKDIYHQSKLPFLCELNQSPEAVGFSELPNANEISSRGPLTPDHVIHTKRLPLQMTEQSMVTCVAAYAESYRKYFASHSTPDLKILDVAPRWAVWPGQGLVSIAQSVDRLKVIRDISEQTIRAIQWSEKLAQWQALPEKDIFEVEYWELEQAKLKRGASKPAPFTGQVALVTGACQGIGKAIAQELLVQGAAVVAVDIDQKIHNLKHKALLTLDGDLTSLDFVRSLPAQIVKKFGGLDLLVSNAGIFPPGETIEKLNLQTWRKSLDVNLTSHFELLQVCIPFLKLGISPSVMFIASKNVPAPGPGAAAYSAAKAGLTQLARVAALELGPFGIRVNMVHPNAIFDTGIWTPEVLQNRAAHYKMSVEDYKKNNILKVEITSKDVAELVAAMLGSAFKATTGAQVAIDGGNDRVI